LRIHHVRA